MKSAYIFLIAVVLTSLACKTTSGTTASGTGDAKAIAIAGDVMKAMGGQKKWDQLQYVSWTFFGNRHLVWDKKNGLARIEMPKDTMIYLIDLEKMTGKISKGGKEVTDATALSDGLKRAKGMWINDSYWLFMPFKLRDPGVNLKYLREDTTKTGAAASVLELTFNQVGNTPENKYEIFVDKNNLVKQWAYYKSADQTEPPRVWPWDNYQSFDGLLLSANRSDNAGPSNIRVYKKLDDAVFTSFDAFDYY